MLIAGQRVELDPTPQVAPSSPLEVVMLGHCPVAAEAVNWRRVAADNSLLSELHQLGFDAEVRRLRQLLNEGANAPAQAGDENLKALFDLPLPVHSLDQFKSIFRDVFDKPCHYASRLAGANAWLPPAVQDFFDCADHSGELKLWIIRVDETAGMGGFLPSGYQHVLHRRSAESSAKKLSWAEHEPVNLLRVDRLNAFERALLIPGAGIIAMPDLERLSVPKGLERIPSVRQARPLPAFLPCSTDPESSTVFNPFRNVDTDDQRPPTRALVGAIGQTLEALRPDMQCLLTLPFDNEQHLDYPQPCPDFLSQLGQMADAAIISPETGDGQRLRHLQFLYPYLVAANNLLSSPAGVIAGTQARVSGQQGSWRSIAGRKLPVRSMPWPEVDQRAAVKLRERPGVSVLCNYNGQVKLDDETLCVPMLPQLAVNRLKAESRNGIHWRSAEIKRFMGWLQRELVALGNRMIFDADPRDPRPLMTLRSFFQSLYAAGALRGRKASEAFVIVQRNPAEAVLQFDIEIAPAFPIDRIRLTFLQDRHAGSVPSLAFRDNGGQAW